MTIIKCWWSRILLLILLVNIIFTHNWICSRSISKDKVIGLSKINRLVDYYARCPQVQERLVLQILKDLQEVLNTKDVIVMITAKHLCVSSRGIKDKDSFTTTIEYDGEFNKPKIRSEFFNVLDNNS